MTKSLWKFRRNGRSPCGNCYLTIIQTARDKQLIAVKGNVLESCEHLNDSRAGYGMKRGLWSLSILLKSDGDISVLGWGVRPSPWADNAWKWENNYYFGKNHFRIRLLAETRANHESADLIKFYPKIKHRSVRAKQKPETEVYKRLTVNLSENPD